MQRAIRLGSSPLTLPVFSFLWCRITAPAHWMDCKLQLAFLLEKNWHCSQQNKAERLFSFRMFWSRHFVSHTAVLRTAQLILHLYGYECNSVFLDLHSRFIKSNELFIFSFNRLLICIMNFDCFQSNAMPAHEWVAITKIRIPATFQNRDQQLWVRGESTLIKSTATEFFDRLCSSTIPRIES